MYALNHPNIVKLYNHFEDDTSFYLILELAEKGNLYSKLKKQGVEREEAVQIIREITLALQYMHSRDPPIIHRDIKPENILLDAEGRAKLGDFGWSNFTNSDRTTYCGTLEYLAPEMIDRTGHSVKLDVWGIGVLVFELFAGKAPFESNNQKILFDSIRNLRLEFPSQFPPKAQDLVNRLLKRNPEERLSVDDILKHPLLNSERPTRKTIGPSTTPERLPELTDNNIQEFQEHEYKVISNPTEHNEQLHTEKSINSHLKERLNDASVDLQIYKDRLARIEEALDKRRKERIALTGNIERMKIESLRREFEEPDQSSLRMSRDTISFDITSVRENKSKLDMKYRVSKKELKKKRKAYWDKKIQVAQLEIESRILREMSTTYKWCASISSTNHTIAELKRVVFLIRHTGPAKLIESISKSITQQLSTSNLESLITEIFSQIQKTHDSLSELQDDYIQLQDVRYLKKEVETLLGIDR